MKYTGKGRGKRILFVISRPKSAEMFWTYKLIAREDTNKNNMESNIDTPT